VKRNVEPITRSLTVLDTRISPAAALAATRAPICTAIPPIFSIHHLAFIAVDTSTHVEA
jgi:hypothetical protein